MKERLQAAETVLGICVDCGVDVSEMQKRCGALAKLMQKIEQGFVSEKQLNEQSNPR